MWFDFIASKVKDLLDFKEALNEKAETNWQLLLCQVFNLLVILILVLWVDFCIISLLIEFLLEKSGFIIFFSSDPNLKVHEAFKLILQEKYTKLKENHECLICYEKKKSYSGKNCQKDHPCCKDCLFFWLVEPRNQAITCIYCKQ
jgi:hypothetical protein